MSKEEMEFSWVDLSEDSVLEEVVAKPKAKKTTPKIVEDIEPTVIETVDAQAAKRRRDVVEIQNLNRSFEQRLASQPKIAFKPPKYYADVMGTIYPFALNGHTVVVRFDGSVQYFPEEVYYFLVKKLGRILDDSAPVLKIDDL